MSYKFNGNSFIFSVLFAVTNPTTIMLLALSKEHPSTNNNHAAGFNINGQHNTEESDTVMNNDNQKNPENSNNCKHSSSDTTSTCTTVIIGPSIGTFSIDE